jgi:hypothetical protein
MLIELNRNLKQNSESQSNKFEVYPSLAKLNFLNLSSAKELSSSFEDFNDKTAYHYISNGKVSSYQLVNFFLDKFCQTATLYITTWGMTELAIRNLASRKKAGQIKELYFVFSEQTKVNKANEFQLAISIATAYKMMPCHAKIYLIKTDSYQVSIITSANLNRNNKLEAGTITGDLSVYEGYSKFLSHAINS